jgi:hypothetical protein
VRKNTHPVPVSIQVRYECHPRVKNHLISIRSSTRQVSNTNFHPYSPGRRVSQFGRSEVVAPAKTVRAKNLATQKRAPCKHNSRRKQTELTHHANKKQNSVRGAPCKKKARSAMCHANINKACKGNRLDTKT